MGPSSFRDECERFFDGRSDARNAPEAPNDREPLRLFGADMSSGTRSLHLDAKEAAQRRHDADQIADPKAETRSSSSVSIANAARRARSLPAIVDVVLHDHHTFGRERYTDLNLDRLLERFTLGLVEMHALTADDCVNETRTCASLRRFLRRRVFSSRSQKKGARLGALVGLRHRQPHLSRSAACLIAGVAERP
jgi:hypothetical protein